MKFYITSNFSKFGFLKLSHAYNYCVTARRNPEFLSFDRDALARQLIKKSFFFELEIIHNLLKKFK